MIKKTLILLAIIVAFVGTPQYACAQMKTGRWAVYPTIGDTFSDIIDANGKVYMLTAGKLYHYSLEDNETYAYNTTNKLSDGSAISSIYYNRENKYLFVAYSSGNIDLLYDNGKVVNMFDIKDAVLTTGHGINYVSFYKDRIYVATQFGFVVFDDKRHEVIESGIFDINVNFVFAMGEHMVLLAGTDMYVAPLDIKHNKLDKFTSYGKLWHSGEVLKIADDKLIYLNANSYYRYDLNFAGNTGKAVSLGTEKSFPAKETADGAFLQEAGNYTFVDTLGNVSKTAIPAVLKGKRAFTAANSVNSLWVAESDGLAHYDLSTDTPTQLMAPFKPDGFTVNEPCLMRYSDDGERLYVANVGPSFRWAEPGDNFGKASYLDIIEDGDIRDAAVCNAGRYTDMFNNFDSHSNASNWVTDPATDRVGSNSRFVEDPDDPTIYYIANNNAGVIVVKDGEVINVLNKSNTTVPADKWRLRTLDVNIDRHGNLWMGTGYSTNDEHYAILPADKRRNITGVKSSDWYKPVRMFNAPTILSRDTRSLFCKLSTCAIFMAGDYGVGLAIYDDNGTSGDTADDRCIHLTSFTDTEGNTLTYDYINNFAEDKNGTVWVVTEQGLFTMNPAEAQNSDFRVKRPIVPRNDGTNYGDYLLEAENIHCVAVDPSNRKWLGTATSGVYLVSADGTEIIAHYTTDNSDLPSNQVWSVACDRYSNKVYFGTPNGIASYESDSAPAAEDYSDVYAYPNPVRPDYTGWITVTGLMDNSLVKIADTAGNVLFQGRSEGGMIRWDGCGLDGSRVRSGVYLVFASQNENGRSSGAVAKIMVIQ